MNTTTRISRRLVPIAAISATTLLLAPVSHAEYYDLKNADGIALEGSDIIYQETRYPKMPAHMYNARFFPYFADAKKVTGVSFYSGPAMGGNNQPGTIDANYIQSFWGIDKPLNAGDSVIPDYWNARSFAPLSIGEGASGKIDGRIPMTSDVWYPGVVRVWQPSGNQQNVAKIGQWIKDGVSGKWMLFGIFNVPFAATQVIRDGGFIEDPSTGAINPTRVDFRNYYFRKNGSWVPAQNFHGSARQKGERGTIALIENGTAAYFEDCINPNYAGNIDFDNNGGLPKERTVTMTMPPTPTFDPITINTASTSAIKGQINVRWTLAALSAPQFGYKIEVFPTSNTTGKPSLIVEKKDPVSQNVLIPCQGLKTPTIRLTLTSVFDQISSPLLRTATIARLAPASKQPRLTSGLSYQYFEGANWTNLPNFSTLQSSIKRSGVVAMPELSIRRRDAQYACRFIGYLNIPSDGIWKFGLKSCDGSRFIMDGSPLIASDGPHSAGYEVIASRELKAGQHAVELQYFRGDNSWRSDKSTVELHWEGPNTARGVVPITAWSHIATKGEPTITFASPANNSSITANSALLTATVSPNGQPLQSVRFYNKDTCWAATNTSKTVGKKQLFSSSELLGVGANLLKARLIYGAQGQFTIDSPVISVNVTQPNLTPWQFSAIGPHRFQPVSSVAEQTHTLVGDNLNFNWQQITGDTTIITHIKQRPNNSWVSQFDGSDYDEEWSGGLIFRQDLTGYPGSEIGKKFVALFATTNNEIHLQDNTNHNPGGYYWPRSIQNNARSYNWLKLQRVGNIFHAFLSEDGLTWTAAGTRDMSAEGFSASMYAGVYTLARPGNNPNPNRWQFANVTIGNSATSPPK
ncbi:hypothetical protein EON83_09885 [bacterium]|nr:MAG: hypothetical protein EON83_09885 [bacterium]